MGSLLSSHKSNEDIEGYHILQVQENSPAQNAGLEHFFDFIIAISNVELTASHDVLLLLLRENIGKSTKFKIYSQRTNQYRDVYITPNADWGGNGLLGLTIRFCTVKEALKDVQHILQVYPNSPAAAAGLQPYTDYIIGVELSIIDNDADFVTIIKNFEQRPLKVFVYSIIDNSCRSTRLIPNSKWGGDGAIGCDIASGYLHQIPIESNVLNSLSIVKSTVNFVVEAIVSDKDEKETTASLLVQTSVQIDYQNVNKENLKPVIAVQPTRHDIYMNYNTNEIFKSQETKIMIEDIDDGEQSDNVLLPCDVL